MQIDFHYAVTCATALLAGFAKEEAEIISYSAQYVDDAISDGTVTFDNGAMFSWKGSAHKMLDYKNFEQLANHYTWVPFHFLPGNGGLEAGKNPKEGFIKKLVCYPNSFIAKEMVESCIKDSDKSNLYGLIRLGITMHVLADTFAHQGFAGVSHKINKVTNLVENTSLEQKSLMYKIKDYFGTLFDDTKNDFIGNVSPLGHGPALSYPDLPFLKWEYKNGLEESVKRDNTDIFMKAVKAMHLAMVQFRKRNPSYKLLQNEEIKKEDLDIIEKNFITFIDKDGEVRNEKWLNSIKSDAFSFNKNNINVDHYICNKKDSWKDKAVHVIRESDSEIDAKYNKEFLESNWKLFHDALQFHQIEIIRNILPKYGICLA